MKIGEKLIHPGAGITIDTDAIELAMLEHEERVYIQNVTKKMLNDPAIMELDQRIEEVQRDCMKHLEALRILYASKSSIMEEYEKEQQDTPNRMKLHKLRQKNMRYVNPTHFQGYDGQLFVGDSVSTTNSGWWENQTGK